MSLDVTPYLPSTDDAPAAARQAFNSMAASLGGSVILRIAGEIGAMIDDGAEVCNLSVGDFNPTMFPVPQLLSDEIIVKLGEGQTNYPPAIGITEVREAVRALYKRDLGLDYPLSSVVMGAGARPAIFAAFSLLVDEGDRVVYPVPSWNNNHYTHINGTEVVKVPTSAETNFLPTAEQLREPLQSARLLALNSPLNPCGTAFGERELADICDLILEINAERDQRGERSLMLLWDQVYWMLTFGETQHFTPVGLRPEMARYTVMVDAISKSFAATGLRLGWAIVPPYLSQGFMAVIGHMGAWPARPVQLATADLLNSPAAVAAFMERMRAEVGGRLAALYKGFEAMREQGLPVNAFAPQGSIYLSVQFPVLGRSFRGATFDSTEDVRQFLLDQAGFGVVPFGAFGDEEEAGWVRLSIGAVSHDDIAGGLRRIEAALREVQ